MAAQLLLYPSPVPLDSSIHRDLRLRVPADGFGYAAVTHVLPALAEEFAIAAAELPIVFLPAEPRPVPVFVVGLSAGENLMVGPGGVWDGRYIPAYLRRYPFVLGERAEGAPVLCIEPTSRALDATEGERLFEPDARPTATTLHALKFAEDYLAAARRTDTFMDRVLALGLLRPVQIDVRGPDGGTTRLDPFLSLDETKLAALADAAVIELFRSGALAALYAQATSLRQFDALAIRRARRRAGAA
ncbi:SapC family protein [Prosthecomicrobium sp. N25]|uniref:SapC family protein n=1 Tax=Prosthecomicrobium sp. N25 TaxID=3129254 RepID=UPI003076D798